MDTTTVSYTHLDVYKRQEFYISLNAKITHNSENNFFRLYFYKNYCEFFLNRFLMSYILSSHTENGSNTV